MNNAASRRGFLRSVGVFALVSATGYDSLAQERRETPQAGGGDGNGTENYPYELMICDYVRFKLSRVDRRGKVTWEHTPVGKVWDFVVTEDNKLIYPIITDTQEVRCIDFQENIIWSWPYANRYREIINITQHQSQLILSGQMPPQAIMMSRDGKFQNQLSIPAKYKHQHGQLGNVQVGEVHILNHLVGVRPLVREAGPHTELEVPVLRVTTVVGGLGVEAPRSVGTTLVSKRRELDELAVVHGLDEVRGPVEDHNRILVR